MTKLLNKTALITGASSGVGKAVALSLAKRKCNLICISRDEEKLESLKKEISKNISFTGYVCDLSNEREIFNLIEKISVPDQKIDFLVHSAGLIKKKLIVDSTLEEYYSQFNINFKAPYLITKCMLPKLQNNIGQIVFINSSVVKQAVSELSLYTASKLALKGFADCLRQEVNPRGIKVFTIYLGQTATPMQQELYKLEKKLYFPENLIQPEDIAKIIVQSMELPKNAEIIDLYIRPLKKTIK